jgi:hypothetical protein
MTASKNRGGRGKNPSHLLPHDRGEQASKSLRPDGGAIQRVVDAITHDPATIELSEEELYTCLESERRRRIIRFVGAFYDDYSPTYIEALTLAQALAGRTPPSEGTAGRDDEVHAYYVSISQVHAPLLDDLGVIEYYDRVGKLEPTETALGVAQLMAELSERCVDDGGGLHD